MMLWNMSHMLLESTHSDYPLINHLWEVAKVMGATFEHHKRLNFLVMAFRFHGFWMMSSGRSKILPDCKLIHIFKGLGIKHQIKIVKSHLGELQLKWFTNFFRQFFGKTFSLQTVNYQSWVLEAGCDRQGHENRFLLSLKDSESINDRQYKEPRYFANSFVKREHPSMFIPPPKKSHVT